MVTSGLKHLACELEKVVEEDDKSETKLGDGLFKTSPKLLHNFLISFRLPTPRESVAHVGHVTATR